MIDNKITTLAELRKLRKNYRDENKQVVFANGCFDILHVGHTRYLSSAKKLGDILIVGLNSDNSVQAIKGAGRPILNEEDRILIIASLGVVNHVFIFNEISADSVLKTLQPDIHAKGTDYLEISVPERDTVRSYGGKVAIVGDPKSHSTRDIIKHIKKIYAKKESLDRVGE